VDSLSLDQGPEMRHQTGGHRHGAVDVLHQPADAQARQGGGFW